MDIASQIKDGGNLIFQACNQVCNESTPLLTELILKTNNKINVLFSEGYTKFYSDKSKTGLPRVNIQIPFGVNLTYIDGFMEYNSKGTRHYNSIILNKTGPPVTKQ